MPELSVLGSDEINARNWHEVKNHWRVLVKSKDGIDLADEDFVTGGYEQAWARAVTLGRRASYVPDFPARRVYIAVQRWDAKRRQWVTIREKVGKVRDRFHHSQLAKR